MEWVRVKDRLPEDEDVVIIELNYIQPFFCMARYIDEIETLEGTLRKTFFTFVHPRFPKYWLFTEEYKKISRIHKNKVRRWVKLDFMNYYNPSF